MLSSSYDDSFLNRSSSPPPPPPPPPLENSIVIAVPNNIVNRGGDLISDLPFPSANPLKAIPKQKRDGPFTFLKRGSRKEPTALNAKPKENRSPKSNENQGYDSNKLSRFCSGGGKDAQQEKKSQQDHYHSGGGSPSQQPQEEYWGLDDSMLDDMNHHHQPHSKHQQQLAKTSARPSNNSQQSTTAASDNKSSTMPMMRDSILEFQALEKEIQFYHPQTTAVPRQQQTAVSVPDNSRQQQQVAENDNNNEDFLDTISRSRPTQQQQRQQSQQQQHQLAGSLSWGQVEQPPLHHNFINRLNAATASHHYSGGDDDDRGGEQDDEEDMIEQQQQQQQARNTDRRRSSSPSTTSRGPASLYRSTPAPYATEHDHATIISRPASNLRGPATATNHHHHDNHSVCSNRTPSRGRSRAVGGASGVARGGSRSRSHSRNGKHGRLLPATVASTPPAVSTNRTADELEQKAQLLEAEIQRYTHLNNQQQMKLEEVNQRKKKLDLDYSQREEKWEKYMKEQKKSLENERRTVAQQIREMKAHAYGTPAAPDNSDGQQLAGAAVGVTSVRKERAELEALNTAVQTMKQEQTVQAKAWKVEKHRLRLLVQEQKEMIEKLEEQIVTSEEMKIRLLEFIAEKGLLLPKVLRQRLMAAANGGGAAGSSGSSTIGKKLGKVATAATATSATVGGQRSSQQGAGSKLAGKLGSSHSSYRPEGYMEEVDVQEIRITKTLSAPSSSRRNNQLSADNHDEEDEDEDEEYDGYEGKCNERGDGEDEAWLKPRYVGASYDDHHNSQEVEAKSTTKSILKQPKQQQNRATTSNKQRTPSLASTATTSAKAANQPGKLVDTKNKTVGAIAAMRSADLEDQTDYGLLLPARHREQIMSLHMSTATTNSSHSSSSLANHRYGPSNHQAATAEQGKRSHTRQSHYGQGSSELDDDYDHEDNEDQDQVDDHQKGIAYSHATSRSSSHHHQDEDAAHHGTQGGGERQETIRIADGYRIITYRNGTIKEISLNQDETLIRFTNGDRKFSQRSLNRIVYYYAQNQTQHTTFGSDGMELYEFPNGQVERHHPDGKKEVIFPDQSKKIIYTNGIQESYFLDGVVLREYPDGRSEVISS